MSEPPTCSREGPWRGWMIGWLVESGPSESYSAGCRAPVDPREVASIDAGVQSGVSRAIAAFLLLGCALRIIRYAQNLPLWSDECFLAVNFIKRGYLDLLRPLDNGQIAPFLYLWVERLVLDLAGFSEWSLR